MSGRLAQELRQRKPFPSKEDEAVVSVLRTADVLTGRIEALLAPHGLTSTQYNVLRILRGAGESGLACSAIGERLIARDPDVTRLLDRIEKCGLVERVRSATDRRVVEARITRKGLDLLAALDERVNGEAKLLFKGWKKERIAQLIEDLEQLRVAAEGAES